MASDTDTRTARPGHAARDESGETAGRDSIRARAKRPPRERRGLRLLSFSRLTRLILLSNLAGLIVLVAGALVLNEMRQGLIEARVGSLRSQGALISNVLVDEATVGVPGPELNPEEAREVLTRMYLPEFARVRLYSRDGELIADSWRLQGDVVVRPLDPIEEGGFDLDRDRFEAAFEAALRTMHPLRERRLTSGLTLEEEVAAAIASGGAVAAERINEDGERVVSVSVPVQRVQAVIGVLTLESSDVDEIVAAERRALIPFILVSIGVTILTSLLLTIFIARPIRRLALAADRVRRGGPRRAAIPDLSSRRDDIGDLSAALKAMTESLYDRIDAIESFAADVSHEIKNPLTSIRSAVETLPGARDEESREKLLAVIKNDVTRLDRLITDISRASRLDAELAREVGEPVDIRAMLADIDDLYDAVRKDGEAEIVFEQGEGEGVFVTGLEGLLGQVFRNLLDNARTFSPEGGKVYVTLDENAEIESNRAVEVVVEDEGPGIPPDNLETIFERFYTERPRGAVFGTHSGLGLAIARQIVEGHKGEIVAENRAGEDGKPKGARFRVRLPLKASR